MDIFFGIFVGVLCGTITGLTPGIHTNLIVAILTTTLLGIMPSAMFFVSVTVTMAMIHTYLSAIPNVYLGAGEGSDLLNVLPAHRLLHEGRGREAVHCTLWGGGIAALIGTMFFTFFLFLTKHVYIWIEDAIPALLAVTALAIALRRNQLRSLLILCVSGAVGYLVLESVTKNPLFPLLSGFFGIAILLTDDSDTIPPQRTPEGLDESLLFDGVKGTLLGTLTAFLPGLGSGIATTIGSLGRESKPRLFLVMSGAVDTANFFLGLAALISIDKARNGAVVGIQEVVTSLNGPVLVGLGVVSGGVGILLTLFYTEIFEKAIAHISYNIVKNTVIVTIVLGAYILSGLHGLIILGVTTLIGWYCNRYNVPRTVMMGCILLPVMVYLWL